jgi:hypothetical protein
MLADSFDSDSFFANEMESDAERKIVVPVTEKASPTVTDARHFPRSRSEKSKLFQRATG